MRARLVRIALIVLLGLVLGGVAYAAGLAMSNPAPRESASWTLLATLPTARGETAAAVADEQLYVIGGLTGLGGDASAEVSVYDPVRDSWEVAPALPSARHHAAAVGLNGTVYASGGGPSASDWTPQPTMWALDAGAATWRELTPMPEGRLGHRMLAVEAKVYVVGGIGDTGRVLVYDIAAGTWSAGAEMPSPPRDHIAAVVVDGEIWVIGGRSGGQNFARVDIYDPGTDTWREGPPLPEATSGAAEGVVDGRILISGGENPGQGGGVIDRHGLLDTSLGDAAAWQELSPPPLAVHGAHGATLDGRFLIVGGALRQGAFSRFSWTGANQAYQPE
jgi:N-acetylneuraminic acid mutarotase